MKRLLACVLPMTLLAACGGEAPKEAAKEEIPAAFPAGQWEVTGTVDSVVSKDGSTPAVKAKKGDPIARSACITDAKKLDELFLAKGDVCKVQTAYARSGRINTAYECKRPGVGGTIFPTIAGEYKADSFEARTTTGTTLSGSGDYQLVEVMTGKRTGNCSADATAAAPDKAG